MTTLQVKDVTIIHKKDLTGLVEHLNVVVASGDRIALIGEEGNGKSTLLKLLYDRLYLEQVCDRVVELTREGVKEVTLRHG
jgi:ATPase subunit of ABC transporter with duplicated ATPase domains